MPENVSETIMQNVADENGLPTDKAKQCVRSFFSQLLKQTEQHGKIDLHDILGAGAFANPRLGSIKEEMS